MEQAKANADAYLAFTFSPPSWGHLHVHVYPWLHGYYCLYSVDAWYKGEWARAEVDTWVDLHQNFWRARDYQRRLTLAGDELHPQRCGRIDSRYATSYFTNVGAADTVTIRVGVRLYSAARQAPPPPRGWREQAGVGKGEALQFPFPEPNPRAVVPRVAIGAARWTLRGEILTSRNGKES